PDHCAVFPTRFPSPDAGAAAIGFIAWVDTAPKIIRFKSAEAGRLAGIKTVKLEPRPVQVEIAAHGEVMQDPLAAAKVSPLVDGLYVELEKRLGDPVQAGELLALIESMDVGKAKNAYLTAKVALESREAERALLSPGTSPPASIVKADAAV